MITATKIRLYPNAAQVEKLAKSFGSVHWFWNNSLAETQKLFHETGKGSPLGRSNSGDILHFKT